MQRQSKSLKTTSGALMDNNVSLLQLRPNNFCPFLFLCSDYQLEVIVHGSLFAEMGK